MTKEADAGPQTVDLSRGAPPRKEIQELRRLQSSLREIASLLDDIERRPHQLLRRSAERLVQGRAPKPAESLARYTGRFAATLAKAHASLSD